MMGLYWTEEKKKKEIEAVLLRAQVSARSGKLLWPPGGAKQSLQYLLAWQIPVHMQHILQLDGNK